MGHAGLEGLRLILDAILTAFHELDDVRTQACSG
jgi:hypothetical protein